MNLKIIRLRAMQVLADVLGFFDRGVDGAIDAFTRADRQLDAVKAKLDAKMSREFDLQAASYDRQQEIAAAEEARRLASYDRVTSLYDSRQRAASIQRRIAELLK
jgi:hypothetical protein